MDRMLRLFTQLLLPAGKEDALVYSCPAPKFREATPFDIHLQWFAAEDEGRTEEPTEHKLRKAREEGKVAKSVELSSSLVILFGIATLGLISSFFLKNVMSNICQLIELK